MFFKLCMIALVLLPFAYSKPLKVRNHGNSNSTMCLKRNHGKLMLAKDRTNKDTVIVCTEDNGTYSWKSIDRSMPVGEYFKPGYDCLDILSENPKAGDGYYWIDFHGQKPRKVWCDMNTDGGGYMLIGRINGTKTWDIPSKNTVVEPSGISQWSSAFGNVPVLDFRVQVATGDDLKRTKAHWSYRLASKRLLQNLLIVNKGGCSLTSPGIGDIAHVKNLQTGEIVTRDFKCSRFGGYYHPQSQVGWARLNSCFSKACSAGFAYHPLAQVQVDYSGGFSFQTTRVQTQTTNWATAFFGCDSGKCCACYGPVGGKGGYCGQSCQAKNGGTITQHASAWFWVRSRPPKTTKKIWEKCMEYKTKENGEVVWYKIQGDGKVPTKGRCGGNRTVLNDGVSKELKTITQMLQRLLNDSANKVSQNCSKKVTQSKPNNIFPNFVSCKTLIAGNPGLASGFYHLGTSKVYCDMPSGWSLVARFSNNDAKNWINSAYWWYDQTAPIGAMDDPSENNDMISEGFWNIRSSELKISRSDDPVHTPLLETTSNCLGSKTFREKVTGFGNFRDGSRWASNQCKGSCRVRWAGKYKDTPTFSRFRCNDPENFQKKDHIGFWCDYHKDNGRGDGSIMMIGGGGRWCGRADHGIGITEEAPARFGTTGLPFLYDFGDNADDTQSKTYSLNLWVR